MRTFSYIIPFNQKIDEIHSLRKVLEWLKMFKSIEVIIVEYYEKSPSLNELSYPFLHIPVKNDGSIFSPSWAYNIGSKRSSSDIVIFGNSSTVTNPENIKSGVSLIKNKQYQMVKPFKNEINISHGQLTNFKKMETEINYPTKGSKDDNYTHLCSGISIYDKNSLFKIGGWEENFKMGCYYDFQSYKTRILLNYTELDGKGFYFDSKNAHNSNVVTSDVNLNNKLKSTPKQGLVNYINTTIPTAGMVNRFD
jgi:hypothetical protein